MYRTIDLKNKDIKQSGAFAAYFKLSPRRGVKVYGLGEIYIKKGKSSPVDVDFTEVLQDFDFIREVKCEITPNAHEIVAVMHHGLWYAGIILDHISGVHITDKDLPWARINRKFVKLTGYIHNDLHTWNVLFNKKTMSFKVIDITADALTPTFKRDENAY